MALGAYVGREKPPNTVLQLTDRRAAWVALAPHLLRLSAAEHHVGWAKRLPATAIPRTGEAYSDPLFN